MNNRALTMSLVMAIMAVFFVQSYVTSIEDEAKKKFGTEVMAIVARKDIKEMETINETMIDVVPMPKRFLEPASISIEARDSENRDKERNRIIKSLAGAIAVVPIKKGEQFTYNKLTEPGLRTGLAPQVSPGKRAIGVPVSETSAVAKLVKPGDRIDLIAIIDTGAGKENKLAKTILQDVVVLSTGKSVTNNAPRVIENDTFTNQPRVRSLAEDFSFNTVTLEVDPSQAQMLALVMSSGDNTLTVSLRNNDDTDRVQVGATMIGDVLGGDAARIRAPAGRR